MTADITGFPIRTVDATALINTAAASAAAAAVASAISALVGTAPSTLNTLGEIAAAINNDPTFFATVTSALAAKAPGAESFVGKYADTTALAAAFPPAANLGNSANVAGNKYYSNGTIWTPTLPFIGRSQYFRTPEGADPNGTDSTAPLLKWAYAGVVGDPLFLPAAPFAVSDTVNFDGNDGLEVRGVQGRSKIVCSGTNRPVVRVAMSTNYLGEPSGEIRGITAVGPSAHPVNGQSAWLLDNCRAFALSRCDAQNMDMGLDMINNCFNCFFDNFSVRRSFPGGSVNVGVNLRTGAQNGADHTWIHPQLFTRLAAFHVAGGGGGYRVFGGQAGCEGDGTDRDDLGVVVLGKDYTSGAVSGGGGFDWLNASFEGVHRMWMIRQFAEMNPQFALDLNASSSGAEATLGIYKGTALGNSVLNFPRIAIANGSTFKTSYGSAEGFYDNFWINQNLIVCQAHTVAGVSKSQSSVRGLAEAIGQPFKGSTSVYNVLPGNDFWVGFGSQPQYSHNGGAFTNFGS